jgi:hypothetical protein
MARETDDILMTPELAEYFGAMGFAAARSTTRPGMRGLGEEPTAVAVSVVQKGLNYLTGAGLLVDNNYGPNTARALTSWIRTLPAAARVGYSLAPSTDRPYPHWLYIAPRAIPLALEQAATQPARPTTVVGPDTARTTLAQAAQQFQTDVNIAPSFNSIIETYARANSNQVPVEASNAYVNWYRSTLRTRDMIVGKMRSSRPLQAAITAREPGSIVSQMASTLSTMRPASPNIPASGAAPAVTLGIIWTAPLVLGVVIAVGATVVLTVYEVAQIVESYNLRARLETTLAALRARTVTPRDVPELPGGGEAQVEPGHGPPGGTPTSASPFDWVKWLAIGLGVVAAGLVVYKVADVYSEEQQRKGTASSGWKTGRAQRRLSPGA